MSDTNESKRDNVDDKAEPAGVARLSRRDALSTGGLTVLAGLAGCSYVNKAKDRLGVGQTETESADRQSKNSEPEPLFEAEQKTRDTIHQSGNPQSRPTYEYEPLELAVEEEEDNPIEMIRAAPAPEKEGDRIALTVQEGFGSQLKSLMTSLWSAERQEANKQSALDGSAVTFEIFDAAEIAIGLTLRASADSDAQEQLLLVRGSSDETVRELADSFDRLYETV